MRGLSPELRVIFDEEFRRQLRSPFFFFLAIAIPVLMVVAIPLTPVVVNLIDDDDPDRAVDAGDSPLATVGYVDAAGVLAGPGSQDSPKLYGDSAEGTQAVVQGEIDTLFVLPAGYMDSGAVEEYEVAGEGRNLWGSPAEWAFSGFLRYNLVAGQLDDDLLARALNPANFQRFEVERDGAVSAEVHTAQEVGELLVPMLFGVLLMMSVLMGSGALVRTVYEEKETRMVEMLITSASPLSILTGKLLAAMSAGLIQAAVWVTVGAFAMPAIFHRIPGGQELTISPGLLATVSASFVLGYFLFSVLALFVASVISSQKAANQGVGIFALFAMFPIWLIGLWMNVGPDNILAQIFTWIPFSAPVMLMIRPAMGSVMSSGEIAGVLAVMAVTALAMLWVAARVFRAGILLSGQRITGRNVFEALRHAD